MGNHQPGKNGFPPGPMTVPFLGSVVDLGTGDEFLNKWVELSEEYGSVFSVKIEGRWVVFVTGWEAAREVLVKKGLDFADKPRYPSAEKHNPEYKGIFDAPCGDRWKNQRSFALTTLRSFGFGKVSIEGSITHEVEDLFNDLMSHQSKALDCRDLLAAHTANVLFALTFGLRYTDDDHVFQSLLKYSRVLMLDYSCSSTGTGAKKAAKGLQYYTNKQIQKHADSRSVGEEPRDFIDAYLAKIDEDPENFSYDDLSYVLTDLIGAGIESVSFTLLWSLLYMSLHLDVQDRVHQEIKQVGLL